MRAWAMSRATIIGPVRLTRVRTGKAESCSRIWAIGWFRSMRTTPSARWSSATSGRNCAGSRSSTSRNAPAGVIFALACRSALHETAMATGQEAPWRGRRMTRTSWQKYFPPNCAPMPNSRVICSTSASISRSRNPWPAAEPWVGRPSRALVLASFAVLRVCSALVPPTTIARWYGGQALVPIARRFLSRNARNDAGFSSALVSWKRNDLFAEPPPLAM